MNRDQEDTFYGSSLLSDPRKTGAIPRRTTRNYDYLPSNFQSTIDRINEGDRVCVLLRGLCGSGKSYLAKTLVEMTVKTDPQDHIISADNYFMQNGRYEYDPRKISEAHNYANKLFCQRASKGYSPLIVDNTNKEYWEMYMYIQVATQYGYHIEIMIPNTPWAWNIGKLSQKNVHSVPIEKISFMKERFEKGKSLMEIARDLKCTLVEKPLKRNIPPIVQTFTAKNDTVDLINFTDLLDINENHTLNKPAPSNATFTSSLTCNEFQQLPLQQTVVAKESFFPLAKEKQDTLKAVENNNWSPPDQIFEGTWDQPASIFEKVGETTKGKEDPVPQPQRKQQRKNKKSSSSPSNMNSTPHCRNCPNENPNFANLRELYPNVKDSHLWDLFIKTNFNLEWCANLLCDDNSIENENSSCLDDLKCECALDESDTNVSQPKKVKDIDIKKQTPVKIKKSRNKGPTDNHIAAAKFAIEDSIRIDDAFYPEHVNKVKARKNGPQASSSTSSVESAVLPQPVEDEINDYLIELPIHQMLIDELDDLFGGGLLGTLDRSKKFQSRCLIKRSTAQQLFKDIMENVHSHLEEEKLRKIQDDRNYALKLLEQDKAYKYPILVEGPKNGSFKDIMDTQEALRNYENDTKEWQVVEKPETIACKLSKEKLYAAFPKVNKSEIDNLFEAMNRNFKETVSVLKDSLELTEEERKSVNEIIASTTKIREKSNEEYDDDQDDMSEADYDLVKRAEDIQEEIERHLEEYNRTKDRAREHAGRKEYETASYYNSIASLQKQFSEKKRHDFVNILAELQRRKTGTMIDLHYFKLNEAKVHLHTFLDNKISWLRDVKKPFVELDVITGRGAHSTNGIANMKIMVQKLLQDRNLKPTILENNAGALKVKVYPNSPLCDEILKMKFDQ